MYIRVHIKDYDFVYFHRIPTDLIQKKKDLLAPVC